MQTGNTIASRQQLNRHGWRECASEPVYCFVRVVVVDWFRFAPFPSTSVYFLSTGYRVSGLSVVLCLPIHLLRHYAMLISLTDTYGHRRRSQAGHPVGRLVLAGKTDRTHRVREGDLEG